MTGRPLDAPYQRCRAMIAKLTPTEALIADIQFDVKVALNGLARPGYASYASSRFLTSPAPPTSSGQDANDVNTAPEES